ncbi:MAG: ATP-grasp domain-containing protein, partial [Nocardiopsaceae bacterium]|nr:ATP-grasp domain-containing protein [Nocardiopsaceae bacterium]
MHQGRSFTQQAAAAAAKLGYALVALSSQPDQPEIPQDTRRHLDDCLVTDSPVLNPADIVGIERRFAERGYAVRAAIATFEAYRLLMADINRRVGARDASAEALRLCLNKFELRQLLARRGLSAVRSYRLSPGSLPSLDQSATWFVKPVRGASSFAAFILRDPSRLGDLDLAELQEQMRQDHKMAAIFMDNFDFLVEEYVEGPEFSFETVLLDEAWHLCVHEKARVERLERTTLEVMSVSPPSSVSREAVLRGADFVARCLGELTGLGLAGVFHVEAKYWEARDRWEIIEINPRMGGSLISDSVEALTGESMLELWMTALALTPAGEPALRARLERASQLRSLRDGGPALATVFLSKYGRKGAVVESIDFSPTRPPRVVKMHASAGTVLDHSDRAICLLDAMWTVDSRELAREIDFLDGHATEHFHVAYRGESAESVLQAHEGGKLEVRSKVPLRTRDELARYYTPGFTRAAQAIAADPGGAYRWSIKGNTVAIVTDGTAVSGLGDLGPEAALPVMEGKALLFKEFAGIDAFPLCLRTTDVDEIVRVVTCVEPAFGGIMLEDISAPRCFAIEDRLRAELAVPVLHDDQHATAVSTVAALINGAAYTGKKMRDLTVVISGAGA